MLASGGIYGDDPILKARVFIMRGLRVISMSLAYKLIRRIEEKQWR